MKKYEIGDEFTYKNRKYIAIKDISCDFCGLRKNCKGVDNMNCYRSENSIIYLHNDKTMILMYNKIKEIETSLKTLKSTTLLYKGALDDK